MTLHVCFLWHMHQPPYRDPTNGRVVMPWVRLHGLKDYTDMVLAATATPAARVSFNLVPGLCDQLEEASGEHYGAHEDFLGLSMRQPATLSESERHRIQERFFSLHHGHMLAPHPRYAELYRLVSEGQRLNDAELQDLQCLFNLAWCGEGLKQHPVIARLITKGRDFTETDKAHLLSAQREALSEVLPRYAAAQASGQIELCCSPYYHPILPLLWDGQSAQVADPAAPLPRSRFKHPHDARLQVQRAVTAHEHRFGQAPQGMWPSEGSVSPALISTWHEAGLRWLVTDESILRKSLGRESLTIRERYQPWAHEGLNFFFRDHELSDRIGFVYQSWHTEDAQRDFVTRLCGIAEALEGRDGVVTIALDGENCWEHYPSGAMGFLPGLYERIATQPSLRMSTFSEALEAVSNVIPTLPELGTGSWIDGTFGTWIGDPAKNRGWEQLTAARDAVGRSLEVIATEDPELCDLVMRAEASDWFWWLGHGHSSDFDGAFDQLFRHHLMAIYHHLERPVPEELLSPIDPSNNASTTSERALTAPQAPLRPHLTGRLDSYYKWLHAGQLKRSSGAMHRQSSVLKDMVFGYDESSFSCCVRTTKRAIADLDGLSLELELMTEGLDGAVSQLTLWPPEMQPEGSQWACDDVLEVRLPRTLAELQALSNPHLGLALRLRSVDGDTDRIPSTGHLSVALKGSFLHHENWTR